MSAEFSVIESTFFRNGSEVWIECEHAIVMLPSGHGALSEVPPNRIFDDADLTTWVHELRKGKAGRRIKIDVDEEKKSATIAGLPVSFTGYQIVAEVWKGKPIDWHLKEQSIRALYKGKAIAEIRFEEGAAAYEIWMVKADGKLWAVHPHWAMSMEAAQKEIESRGSEGIVTSGRMVNAIQKMLARSLSDSVDPREADDEIVWIGPVRIQRCYYEMIKARSAKPLSWHEHGPTEPVVACLGGRRIGFIMPIATLSPGGSS